ncbi:FG-GAP repeat protein [Chondromyces crocatus]|uniref:FG-GAP repeat protein n=1 Tax=Chondromyces crocatus TaxID=52 RepID=UPI00067C1602|nr:FG-GAP repeat protein [Chondromyces crocatus]
MLGALSCSSAPSTEALAEPEGVDSASTVPTEGLGTVPEVPSRRALGRAAEGAGSLPLGLRAAYIASVQAGASSAYAVKPAAGGLRAESPAQRLETTLTAEGVQLAPRGGEAAWRFGLTPRGWGCGDRWVSAAPVVPEGEGNRVTYARAGLTEWYVNGPLGLEQGFTVAARPCAAGVGGEVIVALALTGDLHAVLAEDGGTVALRNGSGEVALRYGELHVVDATGRTLAARLQVEGDEIAIVVDDAGAVYPLVIDPLIETGQTKLLAADGKEGHHFGYSVAVAGDTAVVGALLDGERGAAAGAAYVFVRSEEGWTQQAKLLASDGGIDDHFGASVAMSGDTIVVGAMATPQRATAGAAYVFVRSEEGWTQQAKLRAMRGQAGDLFGEAVAISGELVVVGASSDPEHGPFSGAAHVFVRSEGEWYHQAKLTGAQEVADRFGGSVAVSEGTVVVGSSGDDSAEADAGAAYVFGLVEGAWTQQAMLVAQDAVLGDGFGGSVAISRGTVVVGARGSDVGGQDAGAAYVFTRSRAEWAEQAKLVASDGAAGSAFGHVAIAGDTVVVGSSGDSSLGRAAGATYVFGRAGGRWTEHAKLLASDGAADDRFGAPVAISGNTVLVGAYTDDDLGDASGSAFVFSLENTDVEVESEDDGGCGCVVAGASGSGGPSAAWLLAALLGLRASSSRRWRARR